MKLTTLPDPGGTLLRQIIHDSNSPILITDALTSDNPITFVNRAFEVETGYAAAEAIGRNCRFLQGTDRDQTARSVIATAIANGQSCECRLRNYRKDGTMFWNQLYLFPVRDNRSTVTHFVGIQHDISAMMSAQAELQRQREELAGVLQRLEHLSAQLVDTQEQERKYLSHKLQDELGQRLTSLNFLLYAMRPDESEAARFSNWRQAIADMASVIERVRDISIAIRPPALDFLSLDEVIRQLADRTLARAGIYYTLNFSDIPDPLPERIRASIYWLLQEGFTNILHHANATAAAITMAKENKESRPEIRLAIKDNGVGFNAQAWDSSGKAEMRTGLLSMKDRVQLLGGRLVIESAPGSGTGIVIFLPL